MSKRSRGSSYSLRSLLLLLIGLLIAAAYQYITTHPNNPLSGTVVVQPTSTHNVLNEGGTPIPGTAVAGTTNTGLPWLTVYFTDPSTTDENNVNDSHYVYQRVLPYINAAQKTIDVTSFDMNLPEFVDALVAAAKRGVTVRVIADEKNGSWDLEPGKVPSNISVDTLKTLASANIKVVNGGRSNGLMHNKMIIVDSKTLIMGSWNMSYNDTFRNNNNVLIITNPTLIANYQAKFNEGYVNGRFGTKATVKSPSPSVTIAGTVVENYFSPDDKVIDKLIALVKSAKQSVNFIAFTYTEKDLAAAMIDRARNGVKVEGVIENRGASQGALPFLFCAGIPVKTDANKYTMHHKVIIIDDAIVVTGSFNFTETADTANDDNVLIIHSAAVAGMYTAEFQKLYAPAKTPEASSIDCPSVNASATPKKK